MASSKNASMNSDTSPEAWVHPVDFENQWHGSDICFVVEDRKLYANKVLLCMWSPVFKAMFEGGFQERNAKEVTLPGKNLIDFKEFLEVLNPPNRPLSDLNVWKVFALAREYQIDHLMSRCQDFLLAKEPRLELLELAEAYGIEPVRDNCMDNLEAIMKDLGQITKAGDSEQMISTVEEKSLASDTKSEIFKALAKNCLRVIETYVLSVDVRYNRVSNSTTKAVCITSQHSVIHSHNCRVSIERDKWHAVGACTCNACTNCLNYRNVELFIRPLRKVGVVVPNTAYLKYKTTVQP